MNTPAYDQIQFRFRDNDGTDETDATWRAETNIDDPTDQEMDTVYRIRFTIEETAGNAGTNESFQLEAQVDGGGYFNVTVASTNVQAVASNLTDGNDTTQQISSGAFQGGAGQSTDGTPGGPACDFSANDKWECEISYQLLSADLSGGETIDFRIAGLDAYTVTDATCTVATPSTNYIREAGDGETENITESVTRATTALRDSSRTEEISEAATAHMSFVRSVSDTVEISENVSRLLALLRSADDTVEIGEDSARLHTAVREVVESVELAESIARIWTGVRDVSTTVELDEALARIWTGVREIAATVEIGDNAEHVLTLGGGTAYVRNADSTVQVSEAITRVHAAVREIAESMDLAENTARATVLVRVLDSWLTIWARLHKSFPADVTTVGVFRPIDSPLPTARGIYTRRVKELATGGTSYVRDGSETVEITDSQGQVVAYVRDAGDTVEILDSNERLLYIIAEASDIVNILEALSRAESKSVAETVEIDHSTGPSSVYRRHADDTEEIETIIWAPGTLVREPDQTGERIGITEGVWKPSAALGDPEPLEGLVYPDGPGAWNSFDFNRVTEPKALGSSAVWMWVEQSPHSSHNIAWIADTPLDISGFTEFRFAFYKDTDPDAVIGSVNATFQITFQDDVGGSMVLTIPKFIQEPSVDPHPHRQWIDFSVPIADLTVGVGTIDWSNFTAVRFALTWTAGASTQLNLYLDYMRLREPTGNANWVLYAPERAQVLRFTTADVSRKDPREDAKMEEDRTETVGGKMSQPANLTNQLILGNVKAADTVLTATEDTGDTPTVTLESKQDDAVVTFESPTPDESDPGPSPGGAAGSDPFDTDPTVQDPQQFPKEG